MVTVCYRAELARLTGVEQEHIAASSVRQILRHIRSSYGPRAARAARAMLISVNGTGTHLLRGTATRVHHGDVVRFDTVWGGGIA